MATRRRLPMLGALACAAVALTVLSGAGVREALLEAPLTALAGRGGLAAGLLLAALAWLPMRRRGLRTVLAGAVVLLGLVPLARLVGVDTMGLSRLLVESADSFVTASMPPVGALVLVVVGIALLVWLRSARRRWRREARWAAGFTALLAGLVHAVAHALGRPDLLGGVLFAPLPFAESLALLSLGGGLVAGALRRWPGPVERRTLAALSGALVLAAASLLLSLQAAGSQVERVSVRTEATARGLGLMVETGQQERLQRLQRMAMRAGPLYHDGDLAGLRVQAREFLDEYAGVDGIGLLDADFRILAVEGAQRFGLDEWVGTSAAFDAQRRELFEDAVTRRATVTSAALDMRQGGTGFLLASPVEHEGRVVGLIIGALQAGQLFEQLLQPVGEDHHLSMSSAGRTLYRRPTDAPPPGHWFSAYRTSEASGLDWTVRVWPSAATLQRMAGRLPGYLLLLSLLVAVLLYLALRAAFQSGERARRLDFARRRWEAAQELAGLGWWSADYDTGRLVWSAQTYAICGRSPQDFVPTIDFVRDRLMHPDDRERLKPRIVNRRAYDGVVARYRIVRPDGTVRHVQSVGRHVPGGGNRIEGSIQDVTGQVLAEQAVARHSAQLGEIAALAREVAAMTELGPTLERIVQRARAIVGAHQAVLRLRSDSVLKYRFDRPALSPERAAEGRPAMMPDSAPVRSLHRPPYAPVRLSGQALREHPAFAALDDLARPLPQSWLAAPIVNREGRCLGTLELADRIDGDFDELDEEALSQAASLAAVAVESAALLDEVRTLNTQLESRVVTRTRQLNAANDELKAFAYSVSHDLRAPLRRLNAYAELLQQGAGEALDGRNREHLRRIVDSAAQMSRLIDDLMSLSRVSSQELARMPVRLDRIAEAAFRRLQEPEPQRRVRFTVDGPMPAVGDPGLLATALENLLDNALKYTRNVEDAQVHVGCRNVEDGVEYYVRDNGAGFDMRYVGQLFRAFQRLHPASEYPGNGIGLATVRRVIERHGGRVRAWGEPGGGAEIAFTLGAGVSAAQDAPERVAGGD